MKICIVSTLKSSIQDTLDFVNYHLNIGFDHLFLFFDNPNDPSIPNISSQQVTCIRCDLEHWKRVGCKNTDVIETRQKRNANLALGWAAKDSYDWISHIDSDELLHSNKSIKAVLRGVPENHSFVLVRSKEAVPERLEYKQPFQEITLFRVLPSKDHNHYSGKNESAYYNGEFFRAHQGKSIVRISHDIKSLMIHYPIFNSNKTAKFTDTPDIALLHFDCYDFQSWLIKWARRIDGSATMGGGRSNRIEQFDIFRQFYKNGNSKQLVEIYKKMYFINKKTRNTLRKEKMLQSIELNKELFKRIY